MTALDLSSLKIWESVGEWGFVFVWVGVAGEGVEIFIKLFRPNLYDRKKFCLDVIGAIFWMILVAGLAVEFWGNHKAMRIADAENARLHVFAANTESNSIALSLTVEELRKQNDKLKAAMPRRTISEIQREVFIEVLSNTKNVSPKIPIKIIVGNTNQEADDFAQAFRSLLNEAGYTNDEEIVRIPWMSVKIYTSGEQRIPDVVAFISSPNSTIHSTLPFNTGIVTSNGITYLTTAPPPPFMAGDIGSVAMFIPSKTAIEGGEVGSHPRMYRYTENPNDILYGISSVLNYIGITTAGPMSSDMILKPGEVGFFIPIKVP